MIDILYAKAELARYRAAKRELETRVLSDEKWYGLRHWDVIRNGSDAGRPEPASAWLFNVLINKHADVMDNIPNFEILPRERGDEKEAKTLSLILPAILQRGKFEQKYSDLWWDKLKHGTAVYGVFWNAERGGDVEIKPIDILNIFWEPNISDIQQSENLFILGGGDTVDWYYKIDGALHFCKYRDSDGRIIFASEDLPEYLNGFYAHGQYPVVFDRLFPEKYTPAGFGYISVCKNPQMFIDKLGQNILESSLLGTRVRYFVSESTGVNEEEFLDFTKPLVRVAGSIDDARIRQIAVNPPVPEYLRVYQMKVDEMKETAGNRDFNAGGAGSGVTAASAIAAIQTAGGKLSRDMITGSRRAYSEVGYLAIELIRQFYGKKRTFRIAGRDGYAFVDYSNAQLGDAAFDVEIRFS